MQKFILKPNSTTTPSSSWWESTKSRWDWEWEVNLNPFLMEQGLGISKGDDFIFNNFHFPKTIKCMFLFVSITRYSIQDLSKAPTAATFVDWVCLIHNRSNYIIDNVAKLIPKPPIGLAGIINTISTTQARKVIFRQYRARSANTKLFR